VWTFTKSSKEGFESPLEALGVAEGTTVYFLDDSGNIAWEADATRTLHEFALWCAEQALSLVENPDPRSVEALRVKRLWLDREASDEELEAARAAARSAAWAAAKAAVRSAAWDVAQETQSKELERRLLKLQPEPPKRSNRYALLGEDWL